MTSTMTAAVTSLSGDPDAIRTSGRRWRTAAMACAAAAAQVSATAVVDGFLGDEAGIWKQRLRPDTSELLSTLATARDIVGGALVAYAEVLESCQQELRALAAHRSEAGTALDRWRNTPAAEPDLVDSAAQTVHDLDARAAAVLARHTAGVRACCVQIDRATAMAPGHVAGVRAGVTAGHAAGGPGRFRQSSNAVLAGYALTHPAQLSAFGPLHANDNPQDIDNSNDWIDPATRQRYHQDLYRFCLGTQPINTDDLSGERPSLDSACQGFADSALSSPDTLVQAVTLARGAIAMPPLPKTTFGDVWNDFIDALQDMRTMAEQAAHFGAQVMIGGCMEGGNLGACIYDIATLPIPGLKGAKAVKAGVELVEDGADVVKAGEKAAEVGAGSARASKIVQFGPFNPEQVMAAASAYDRNGFTRAGRGLQKHAGRADSVFRGLSTGSSKARNLQGYEQVRKIIDDATTIKEGDRVVEIYDSRGWGVRMRKADGTFLGFLEPGR